MVLGGPQTAPVRGLPTSASARRIARAASEPLLSSAGLRALLRAAAAGSGVLARASRTVLRGTVAVGAEGCHCVDQGEGEGIDPLIPFRPHAAAEVRRTSGLAHVGDLNLNSGIGEGTGEVAAFEELVGCHGGLGGWQGEAVLVYPSSWSPPGPLVGADAVHHQLLRWLEELREGAKPATSQAD